MTPDSTHNTTTVAAPDSLLGPDDPAPLEIVNAAGRGRAVLTADHAGRAFPRRLMGPHANDPDCDPESALGLAPGLLATHIAWDIGIGAVTRLVATHLDAPAAIGIYSRLAIDLNRAPGIESSIVVESDRIAIPGNQGISPDDRHARERDLFRPYHHAIGGLLDARATAGRRSALVSLHSFTPVMDGFERPWHVGILWNGHDGALALPLLESLRAEPGLCVGDNEPYDGRGDVGFTMQCHADPRGLPNVLIELRQDLIATETGQHHWAGVIAQHLAPILADDSIYPAGPAG